MKKEDFDNLVESIRQAGRIKRGEAQPSRVTEIAPVDVKAIRQRLGKSQSEFAQKIGVSLAAPGIENKYDGGRKSQLAPDSRLRQARSLAGESARS